MKKLALFLAGVFVASTLSTSAFVASASLLPMATLGMSSEFTDVNNSTTYSDSIEWMKNNEIATGYDDGSFGIDKCVKRVEFLKMLYKTQDIDVATEASTITDSPFKDIPTDAWYTPYVKVAKKRGTVNGYPDNTFRPAQCITRSEAAKIATLTFNNNSIPEFSDTDYYYGSADDYSDITKNSWSYPYMDYAIKANAIGTEHTWDNYDYKSGTNKFKHGDSMTRAEAAELFFRFRAISDNNSSSFSYGDKPLIKSDKLFYNNCTKDSTPMAEFEGETLDALPKNPAFVMGADHSDSSQLKNIEKIFSKLTKQDFWKEASSEIPNLSLFTSSPWEMAIGVEATSLSADPTVVIAGKFEETDEFENFFKELVAEEMNYSTTCKQSQGVTYWTNTSDEFYFARYGKMFILSNTQKDLTQSISRLQNGNGFAFSNNFNSGKLAYLYVNEEFVDIIQKELKGELEAAYLGQLVGTIGSIGEIYAYIKSDKEGFLMASEADIKNAKDPLLKNYINSSPTLVDLVPGEDTLLYLEDVDLAMTIELMASSSYSDYDDILSEMATELGVSTATLDSFLSAPYAFSISSNDSFLPTFSFHLKLDNGDTSTAYKIIDKIEEFVDEGIADAEVEVAKSVTSSDLNKVTLNIDSIPNSESDQKMKNSLKKSGVELYYGISNNTLVIALYPDFEKAQDSSLASNSTFNQAIKKLNGVYGGKLSYINITNIISYVETLLSVVENDAFFMPSDDEIASMIDILGMFKYFISSTDATSSSIKSNAYLRIGN